MSTYAFSGTFKRTLTALLALFLTAFAATASAQSRPAPPDAQAARDDIAKTFGFVPGFFRTVSDVAIAGVWTEMKGLQMNPGTALTGRTKELVGLAVASQVPCKYCVYAHTEFAKLNGATDEQITEAIAVGALARHTSAYVYGMQLDEAKLRADVARIVQAAGKKPAAAPAIVVVDGKTARADIEQTLGFVPELWKSIPELALPGAWREMKSLELSPTSITAKDKALIGLAVAAQVPSRPCIVADTEFAKLAGATDREIQEAVGMAAITRNMSTLLNGAQVDERAFKGDIDRIVSGVKAAAQRKTAAAH